MPITFHRVNRFFFDISFEIFLDPNVDLYSCPQSKNMENFRFKIITMYVMCFQAYEVFVIVYLQKKSVNIRLINANFVPVNQVEIQDVVT